jgi:T-complex protein 1 subunit delta
MTDRNMTQHDSEKSKDVRQTNITAARAVADVVRTSLGPKGMDKMVSTFKLLLTLSIDPRLKG